jgi:hypothetical protein
VTPRDELLTTRRLGEAGALLVYQAVRIVAISRGFPPPKGSDRWDQGAVEETAHRFVQGEKGAKRLLDLVVKSTDDASFERLLDTAVLNFLRSDARSTDMGKLIVKVKEILRENGEFEVVPRSSDRWMLAGGPSAPSEVGADQLASATRTVEVTVPKWTSTHRDAPLADGPSYVRLLVSVLATAAGSLTAVDLAHALTARLDHRKSPISVELDTLEKLAQTSLSIEDPAARVTTQLRAGSIFQSLTDRERVILAMHDENLRDVGAKIHMRKSQTGQLRQRVIDRLREEVAEDDDPESTVTTLCSLCEHWLHHRTGQDGTTSSDLRA